MTLREITGKKLRVAPFAVYSVRGSYTRRHRVFDVFLECQHKLTVPFGRRPQVGRRMHCPECAARRCRRLTP